MVLAFHQFYMVDDDFEDHFEMAESVTQEPNKDKVWLINEPDACKEVDYKRLIIFVTKN